MTTKTTQTMWRLTPSPDSPAGGVPITYCHDCALTATNISFVMLGMEPAQDMQEAAKVVEMILALTGDADASTFLTSVEDGPCEECGATLAHNTPEGNDAA